MEIADDIFDFVDTDSTDSGGYAAPTPKRKGFRFSYEKLKKRVAFNEFKRIAGKLEEIVRSTKGSMESKILTCEDQETYNWSTVTIMADEVTEGLKNRKEYSLDQLSKEVWDRAHRIELYIRLPDAPEPFMICLDHDKFVKKRLFFYGQALDEETHQKIMEKLHKESDSHRLGDGFHKPSMFAYAVAVAHNKCAFKK